VRRQAWLVLVLLVLLRRRQLRGQGQLCGAG
jgi:hypothetical protein